MRLTRAEHRIFQLFLNIRRPLNKDDISEVILCGRRKAIQPRGYIFRMRPKIAPEGWKIEMMKKAGYWYSLKRTSPLRNRAGYMRDFRARRSARPSNGSAFGGQG